jgi:hypothetical protein
VLRLLPTGLARVLALPVVLALPWRRRLVPMFLPLLLLLAEGCRCVNELSPMGSLDH